MGADRTIELNRQISAEGVEDILRTSEVEFNKWNERLWDFAWKGWKSHLDIELKGEEKLHLHYGYWSSAHTAEAEEDFEKILKILTEMGLVKDPGSWSY